ncbi:MAG: peptide chain release factor N(5)-glutamine methyltransferase, partial [Ignavibacteriaceae bacterium]|nr:peptide chain release factor N(5)-glutamine methyltransferase [Ignavibacteriaceae bacterium]
DNKDGLTFYREISSKVSVKLKESGKLFFEVAQGQSGEVIEIMTKNNYENIKVIKDYQNIERIIFGEKK